MTTTLSPCALCGEALYGEDVVCSHHGASVTHEWAVANRIMCDFFHRRKPPPRLCVTERDAGPSRLMQDA